MKNLITIKEVQALLGVGKDWIYDRIKRGDLKAYKLGRYLRFNMDDIETLVEKSSLGERSEAEGGRS
jgi:excisionase family DNA binding protein